ncbi:hypothetical protein H105_01497 [Trichophyton soudanense CBS 452.61]|uniref:Uncharacterized protein n=1 Tax=Trichophyton soudanense CBS 452.61 TaxID=1215331 RepID=A0A022Y3K5_TRISD|nr:hypothetical protein H105_01497 [Trichophyton soudanense CBS 452.61]EZG09811.1 hypothetical protein H106_01256 [Trichophyton rubrum CBS 735.88]
MCWEESRPRLAPHFVIKFSCERQPCRETSSLLLTQYVSCGYPCPSKALFSHSLRWRSQSIPCFLEGDVPMERLPISMAALQSRHLRYILSIYSLTGTGDPKFVRTFQAFCMVGNRGQPSRT